MVGTRVVYPGNRSSLEDLKLRLPTWSSTHAPNIARHPAPDPPWPAGAAGHGGHAAPSLARGQPDHIAFVYADDLWICDLDGGNARRLTSDPGVESDPAFSPDGRTIAFSGQYDAASPGFGVEAWNVYTIPVTGGEPTRLTWHPGWDIVRGWTPDGKAVLFNSWREVAMGNDTPLFTVPAAGGFPSRLPVPHGHEASYSPDGSRLAYMPQSDATAQWKNYRGGGHSRIWIQGLKDLAVEEISQPAGSFNMPFELRGEIDFI